MNKNRGRIAAALSALALACGITIAAAPAAQADAFPAVTFRMQTATNGQCLTVDTSGLPGRAPCSLLNLRQQWTWNALTEQLVNVGTLQCLKYTREEILDENDEVIRVDFYGADMVTCSATAADQKWQRYPDENFSTRWYVSPSGEENFSLRHSGVATGVGVESIFSLGGPNQAPYQWTFTLV